MNTAFFLVINSIFLYSIGVYGGIEGVIFVIAALIMFLVILALAMLPRPPREIDRIGE